MAKKTLKTLRRAQGFYPVLPHDQHGRKHGEKSRAKRSRRMKKGVFITFEGIEGCGKTTQSKRLFHELRRAGYRCEYTREPGGTRVGEKIRDILLHLKGASISPTVELLLFEAARAQIVAEVIRPHLAERKVVICDRFYDATLSYQGYAGGIPLEIIHDLNRIATGGLSPDLTLLFDVDTRVGLSRAKKRGGDRIESKKLSYHDKVRKGYLTLAKKYPERIVVIDGSGPIDEIHQAVMEKVRAALRG